VYDTNLIFNIVIGLQASTRKVDIDNVLNHELAPIPTSMFFETGDLRIEKAKSVLQQQLQVVSPNEDHSDKFTCCVLSESAMLYVSKWPANGTVNDFLNNFKALMKMYHVFLVFDRYNEFSTKSVTRSMRQSKVSKTHTLTKDMIFPAQSVALVLQKTRNSSSEPYVKTSVKIRHFIKQ